MKIIAILAVSVSISLTSCSTKRFADVVPATRGTALGDVSIGKENADYFVIPAKQSFDGSVAPTPASVVVFKTKERHPSYRTANLVGAPFRTVNKVSSGIVGGVTDIAGALVTQPFQKQDFQSQPLADHPSIAHSSPLNQNARSASVAVTTARQHGNENPATHQQPSTHTNYHQHNPYRNPLLIHHY